jgi:hypothetical protein
MRKITTLFVIVLTTLSVHGQKITSKYDPFLKATRLETGWMTLHGGIYKMLGGMFRSVDNTPFFIFNGFGSHVIGSDDQLIFLLTDDSMVTCVSTEIQSYTVGQYGNTWKHQYSMGIADMERLAKTKVKQIRKYTSDGYIDYDVPEKNAGKFSELAGRFLSEMAKATNGVANE